MAFVLHSLSDSSIADIDFHIYTAGELEISQISKNAIYLFESPLSHSPLLAAESASIKKLP